MGIGGALLIVLFFCPWHGVSSWQLLETLAGADFVRQLFYLTGGIVLVACALLPLPFVFRAAVGTGIAAMPVVLGAHGVIDGWRGVVAALAILGLPATHLLRSRAQSSAAARLLVILAVAAVALLYVLPVSSVVPIALIFKMMASGLGAAIFAVFLLVPLVFAALSLFGVLGRDLTDIAVLLSVLILLWAPVGMAHARAHDRGRHAALRRSRALVGVGDGGAVAGAAALAGRGARARRVTGGVTVGASVQGRAIEAFDVAGSVAAATDASVGALVFGAIHGDEPGVGRAVPALPRRARRRAAALSHGRHSRRQSRRARRRPQEQRARRRPQPQLRRAHRRAAPSRIGTTPLRWFSAMNSRAIVPGRGSSSSSQFMIAR